MTKEIYKIHDRENGAVQGAYMRSYWTQYEFESPSEARNSNVHGIYSNKARYAVAKYRVTYELIEEDVDPPNEEDLAKERQFNEDKATAEAILDKAGAIEGWARADAVMDIMRELHFKRICAKLAKKHNQD